MKRILNSIIDAFLTGILCITSPLATLSGTLAGLCGHADRSRNCSATMRRPKFENKKF